MTGFGGRLLRLGGDMIGGAVGEQASQLGWDAEFMRDTVRGSTRDKALAKAVEQMKPYFKQCHNCGQWVCDQVCWNTERGLCVTCAPKLDQAIGANAGAGADPAAEQKIQAQDWTKDINYRDQATGAVPVLRPGKRRGQVLPGLRPPAGRRAGGEEVLRQLRNRAERREVLRRVRHPG